MFPNYLQFSYTFSTDIDIILSIIALFVMIEVSLHLNEMHFNQFNWVILWELFEIYLEIINPFIFTYNCFVRILVMIFYSLVYF